MGQTASSPSGELSRSPTSSSSSSPSSGTTQTLSDEADVVVGPSHESAPTAAVQSLSRLTRRRRRLSTYLSSKFASSAPLQDEESVPWKKRWYTPRRWSKQPATDDHPSTSSTSAAAAAASIPQTSSGQEHDHLSVIPEGLHNSDTLTDNARVSSASRPPAEVVTPPVQSAPVIPLAATPSTAGLGDDLGRSIIPDPSGESSTSTENSSAPLRPVLPPAQRPFAAPSPGTLVVVQGVVQTAPNPPASAPTTTSTPTPNNTTTPSPPVTLDHSQSRSRSLQSPRTRIPGLFRHSSTHSISADGADEVSATSPPNVVNSETTAPNTTSAESNPSGPISANSVEILGALLGFVAANTAASLLNGTSVPFDGNGSVPMNGMQGPGDPSHNPDQSSAEATRQRLRNAWSNIRERLGPPRNPPSGTDQATQEPPRIPTSLSPELNRAYSFGRSASESAPPWSPPVAEPAQEPPQSPPTSSTSSTSSINVDIPLSYTIRALPPDGSFERFLYDLQAELRVALTTPAPVPASAPVPAPETAPETDNATDPTAQTEATAPSPPPAPANAADINWWRLYRFPAMPPSAPANRNNTPPSAESPQPVEATSTSAEQPPQTRTADNATQTPEMVPVIIIGIQSMPVGGENDETAPTTGDEGDRGRAWTSRAASAIRNLRSNRRNSTLGGQPRTGVDAPGSRMFLIYVIGGYYPSDHHIINSPGSLDLEALWDLADLLGSKPETVSKDDIDKAGLSVIKPSDLGIYEQEGKISSNCLDRCLICLDDYEPETDIRVLGCRHAFHKSCVDTWLSTGKNNCPACRTVGVTSTE